MLSKSGPVAHLRTARGVVELANSPWQCVYSLAMPVGPEWQMSRPNFLNFAPDLHHDMLVDHMGPQRGGDDSALASGKAASHVPHRPLVQCWQAWSLHWGRGRVRPP